MPHVILGPTYERRDERGELREIVNGFPAKALLAGRMNAGAVMGNHYHRRTRVFFFLQSGSADIRTVHAQTGARDAFTLGAEQGVLLEPNESHTISFMAESEWLMLKSEAYDPADPDTYPLPVPD
jgi:dTDP-4-dehydrorhamnose 3,5-epimerase-like enzyme